MAQPRIIISVLMLVSVVSGGEVLFTNGPQEFAGTKYYWLAEWKLEVTLPDDTTPEDRFEVLFGSKGTAKRTLYFEYESKSGSLAHVGQEGYAWIEIPLKNLTGGKKVVLYGKGRERVAFLAGVRIQGKLIMKLQVKPIPTAANPSTGKHSAQWAELGGLLHRQGNTRYRNDRHPESGTAAL
jgi:hypothetical protein